MNKKVYALVFGLAVLMAIGTASSAALAQSTTGGYASIVQKIAERFDLNENEVQAVFDEVHADHAAQRQEFFENRLNEKVTSGDLTADQVQLILDKKEETIAFFDSLKDMSPEQKKEAFQAHHEELKIWADENDIAIGDFHGGFLKSGFGHGGFHKAF